MWSKVSHEPEKNRNEMPYSFKDAWKASKRVGDNGRSPGLAGSVGGRGSCSFSESTSAGRNVDANDEDAGDISVDTP